MKLTAASIKGSKVPNKMTSEGKLAKFKLGKVCAFYRQNMYILDCIIKTDIEAERDT